MDVVIPKVSKDAQQLKRIDGGDVCTRGCSGTMTAGACRRILLDLPRLGGTKMEIVDTCVELSSLERPREELWVWIQDSRIDLDLRTRIGLVLG